MEKLEKAFLTLVRILIWDWFLGLIWDESPLEWVSRKVKGLIKAIKE